MKPSTKIGEIFKKVCDEQKIEINSLSSLPLLLQSVIEYLDEEWEKKLCVHESDGLCYTSNPPQSKCKKCGKFYK